MAGTGSVVRTLSDEALLTGLGSGDPDAAAAFVDRFQRRVFGMTLSILQDRQAADAAGRRAAAGAGASGFLRLHRPRGERTRQDPGRHRQDPDPDCPDETALAAGGTR